MRRFLITVLILFIAPQAFAQSKVFVSVDSLIALSDYQGARIALEGAVSKTSPPESYRLSGKLAEVLILQGKLDEAEALLNNLINESKAENLFLQAQIRTNLGFLYLNKARNDIALDNLQQAKDMFERSGNANSVEAARCLADISLVYATTGKLNQAEENGTIAMQMRQRLLGDASEEAAASYNDMGLIYSQTNPDKALEYFEMALGVYEKLHGKEHRKIAIANNNLGLAYRSLKLYGEAVTSFESAEAIWKHIYPEGHPNQALALVNLGITYGQMGNPTAALGYYERALTIYKKSYGDKHSDISAVLNQMGAVKQDEGKFDEALRYLQSALIANSPSFQSQTVSDNPRVSNYYNAKVMLYSLRLKAETLEQKYFSKTLRLAELRLALQTLQSCDSLIDNIRFNSTNESDKLEIGSSANDVYESGVRIAQSVSEAAVDFRQYRKLAFYFAEKSKSAVLQESVADAEAKSFAGIPAEMLEVEKQLKATMALLSQKLSQKPGADEEAALREKLFAANGAYQAFVRKLEDEYPDYYNLKFNRASPSIEQLQKLIRPEQAVVSYFIAEKGRRLYTFVLTQKSFHLYNSTLPEDFEKLIKGFTNSLYYITPDVYRESAGKLGSLLLRGVPNVAEIIFIPSGRLGTVPFEALPSGKIKEGSTFETFPYLINKSAVSYEFSAGLLLQKSNHAAANNNATIFLAAPVNFPEKDALDDLPATEQEVKNISGLFPSGAKVFVGKDANETLVKSGNLSDYRYLHFATHGIVDEMSPELSRIYLQSSEGDDGNVFSGEIFNLKLNADLCVLSACQTGLGKYSKGEGVIGLSRALVYAGARSIMVSYWSVADASTAELMLDFYKILLQQPRPNSSLALREAKVNMLKKRKFASPYYWAPFVLIGAQ